MNRKFLAVAALTAAAFSAPASAVTVLTFEGIESGTPVGDFYAPDYLFSPATLALVDSDAGGTGNFANEPSPSTIMFFLDANNAILDVVNGFDTGFSFYYSSSVVATVTVYDGAGGTGNVLAQLTLDAQGFDNCSGDPTGAFCNWSAIGVTFDGIARSIDFGGTANQSGFDNITFGSDTPGNPGVPEPATWAMMIMGMGLVGASMRRSRTAPQFA